MQLISAQNATPKCIAHRIHLTACIRDSRSPTSNFEHLQARGLELASLAQDLLLENPKKKTNWNIKKLNNNNLKKIICCVLLWLVRG